MTRSPLRNGERVEHTQLRKFRKPGRRPDLGERLVEKTNTPFVKRAGEGVGERRLKEREKLSGL